MKIAVDAMGGDRAPAQVVKGACLAARDLDVGIILVGDESVLRAFQLVGCHAEWKWQMAHRPRCHANGHE
ncbi:MAG TPA: hypothetical protein EYM83_06425, partial [Nitrospirales bacterium]|nr:hypothetical protein [Nitrospirales bacterium]